MTHKHTPTLLSHVRVSTVPELPSLAIKRYQLWLSLISTSTWQSPIHICQRQWAESNGSPIIHGEPCKALETVGLNRAHTESHRDKSTNAEIDIRTQTSLRNHTPPISPLVRGLTGPDLRRRRESGGGKRRVSEGREDERASVSSPLTERLKWNKMFPSMARLCFSDSGKQVLNYCRAPKAMKPLCKPSLFHQKPHLIMFSDTN